MQVLPAHAWSASFQQFEFINGLHRHSCLDCLRQEVFKELYQNCGREEIKKERSSEKQAEKYIHACNIYIVGGK